MAKPKKIVGKGMGWHRERVRHSRARRTGRAGGKYAGRYPLREDITGLKNMPVYKVKNVDGLIFWTLIKPSSIDVSEDEKVVRTTKINADLFNSMSPTDREFILKEFKALKKRFKDTDKDGTPDKFDCQPTNPKKQDYAKRGFKTFPINKELEIIAHWEKTRNGFRHIVRLMKNGMEIDRAKATYLNRTWERYEYETAIKNLLEKTNRLTETEKKAFLNKSEKKDTEELEAKFKTISMIAKMGEVLTTTPKERIDWKKRMLKAGIPQLDIPEDWETLSDKEKERRLDKVIEFMQQKK